jgi:hypothetical protein
LCTFRERYSESIYIRFKEESAGDIMRRNRSRSRERQDWPTSQHDQGGDKRYRSSAYEYEGGGRDEVQTHRGAASRDSHRDDWEAQERASHSSRRPGFDDRPTSQRQPAEGRGSQFSSGHDMAEHGGGAAQRRDDRDYHRDVREIREPVVPPQVRRRGGFDEKPEWHNNNVVSSSRSSEHEARHRSSAYHAADELAAQQREHRDHPRDVRETRERHAAPETRRQGGFDEPPRARAVHEDPGAMRPRSSVYRVADDNVDQYRDAEHYRHKEMREPRETEGTTRRRTMAYEDEQQPLSSRHNAYDEEQPHARRNTRAGTFEESKRPRTAAAAYDEKNVAVPERHVQRQVLRDVHEKPRDTDTVTRKSKLAGRLGWPAQDVHAEYEMVEPLIRHRGGGPLLHDDHHHHRVVTMGEEDSRAGGRRRRGEFPPRGDMWDAREVPFHSHQGVRGHPPTPFFPPPPQHAHAHAHWQAPQPPMGYPTPHPHPHHADGARQRGPPHDVGISSIGGRGRGMGRGGGGFGGNGGGGPPMRRAGGVKEFHADIMKARDIPALLAVCRETAREPYSAERIAKIYQHLKMLTKNSRGQGRASAEEVLRELEERAMVNMDEFTPRHICMLLGAYAELNLRLSAGLLDAVRDRIMACLPLFDARGIPNCMWALAKLKQNPGKHVVNALCIRVCEVIGDLNPQGVANFLWACVSLGEHPGAAVCGRLYKRAGDVLAEFNPQEVANVLWSSAKLGEHPGQGLFQQLCRRACELIREFNSQGVANVVWAFARLGEHPGRQVFSQFCQRGCAIIGEFNSQGVFVRIRTGFCVYTYICGIHDVRSSVSSVSGCATNGESNSQEVFCAGIYIYECVCVFCAYICMCFVHTYVCKYMHEFSRGVCVFNCVCL